MNNNLAAQDKSPASQLKPDGMCGDELMENNSARSGDIASVKTPIDAEELSE